MYTASAAQPLGAAHHAGSWLKLRVRGSVAPAKRPTCASYPLRTSSSTGPPPRRARAARRRTFRREVARRRGRAAASAPGGGGAGAARPATPSATSSGLTSTRSEPSKTPRATPRDHFQRRRSARRAPSRQRTRARDVAPASVPLMPSRATRTRPVSASAEHSWRCSSAKASDRRWRRTCRRGSPSAPPSRRRSRCCCARARVGVRGARGEDVGGHLSRRLGSFQPYPLSCILSSLRMAAASSFGSAAFAVAAFSTAASAARADAPRPVRLATRPRPFRPTTALVHGLDSSKQTERLATLACEGYPVLAVDLRGHGESALGRAADPAPATPQPMCRGRAPQRRARAARRRRPLDGRTHATRCRGPPRDVAAIVVEDMDVRPREVPAPPSPGATLDAFADDGAARRFASLDEAIAALAPWYGEARAREWVGTRLRPLPGGGVWSDINPAAMTLSRERVLGSDDGARAWRALAARAAGGESCGRSRRRAAAACAPACRRRERHRLHADGGGIHSMSETTPAATVHEFPHAGHSIHNSRIAKRSSRLSRARSTKSPRQLATIQRSRSTRTARQISVCRSGGASSRSGCPRCRATRRPPNW